MNIIYFYHTNLSISFTLFIYVAFYFNSPLLITTRQQNISLYFIENIIEILESMNIQSLD